MTNTFALDKRTFVSGLFWQPLSGLSSDYRKETRRLAEELKFDLAVWRTTTASQVGLGSVSDGLKPGLLSAAAVISKTLEIESGVRDFLCAAEIPGGRWLYVAQREGVILPDGDIVGGEDEIKSRLLNDLSLGSWPLIYAPEHWGVYGATEERAFVEFLPQKGGKNDFRRWWGLQPVDRWASIRSNPSKILVPMIIIAAIAAGGMYGFKTWQNKKAAETARIAELQAAAEGRPVMADHPWKNAPRAREYLKSCMSAMSQVKSLWPGNWTPMEATCANGMFTVLWKRQEWGWIDHLRAVEPKAILAGDGSAASLSIPLVFSSGEDEAVPLESDRTLDMHGIAQKYRFSVTLAAPPAHVAMPGQENAGKEQQKQDWREMKWEAKGISLPPDVVLAALDGNGFRVSRVQAVFAGGIIIWNMEGTQYVKP